MADVSAFPDEALLDRLQRAAFGYFQQAVNASNGLVTDKLTFAMYQMDPFPKNFGSDKPPEIKGDKAYGRYKWEPLPLKNMKIAFDPEWQQMDPAMFLHVLAPEAIFGGTLELVKEGDEWKLNIPTNLLWETNVGYFNDNYKRYYDGLNAFKGDMLNHRTRSAQEFETEVLKALKNAKK